MTELMLPDQLDAYRKELAEVKAKFHKYRDRTRKLFVARLNFQSHRPNSGNELLLAEADLLALLDEE